ncbi:hypothetical protein ACH5RR_029158 [Cinchona calisaya]|uniref:RNase H type-1 domain-containing protein n=1 Tax=Cinchona calisaya TaxID=153742 RepID=A0ABD2YQV3_9GENT
MRNSFIFDNTPANLSSFLLAIRRDLHSISRIKLFPTRLSSSFIFSWQISFEAPRPRASLTRLVVQDFPLVGLHKLNIDGSSLGNLGAGEGGIIRTAHGIPVVVFSLSFSYKTNMEAEMLALLTGIQLCIDKGLLNVFIETDSLILFKMIQGHTPTPWKLDSLLRKVFARSMIC